jgi:surface polysaccharide O-acyltransferase-like enzyme
MLSGALLLDPARTEAPGVFYRKRLARLGVPIAFWTTVFLFLNRYYNSGWVSGWGENLRNLLLGQPYPHLHFVYRIAILYAFTPMFRVFVKHAPRPMLVSAVTILFCVWSADSVINAYTGTNLSAFARFAPFISYYLAGYLLRESYARPEHIKWYAMGFFTCAALLAGITGWLCLALGFKWYPSIPLFLYDFLSPVRIPMALCAWVLLITFFRNRRPESSRSAKLFAVLAPTTLGLYLIHPLFRELLIFPWKWRDWCATNLHMGFLWRFNGLDPLKPNVFVGILVTTVVVYVLSLVSVWILMRIPVARRIVE